MFIGWFLKGAAAMSYRQLLVRELLQGVPVGRLMRRQLPPAVHGDDSVGALVEDHMLGSGEQSFLVIDGYDRALGLVQAADVRRLPRDSWPVTPIAEIAAPLSALPQVDPRRDAFEALRELGRRDVDELAVVDDGRLVGLIRRSDIARWLELQAKDEVSAGRMRRAAGSI